MATACAASKKRAVETAASSGCKKAKMPPPQQQVASAQHFMQQAASMGQQAAMAGWSYPPLPLGMPFFPPMGFMGSMGSMGFMPPFPMGMMPGMMMPFPMMPPAMMPAASAGQPCMDPSTAMASQCLPHSQQQPMQQQLSPFATLASSACAPCAPQQLTSAPSMVDMATRTSSGVSGAFPSMSCCGSAALVAAPASPPPRADSPGSVCNNSVQNVPEEDNDFAHFIDNFLKVGDDVLGDDALDAVLFKSGVGSSVTIKCDEEEEEEPRLSRSDSLMNLLGADLDLPNFC